MHITFDLLTVIVGYILLLLSIINLQLPLTSPCFQSTTVWLQTPRLHLILNYKS